MKYIKIICTALVIGALLTGCGVLQTRGHKNTTGSTKYSASEVELNCTNVTTGENGEVTTNVDVLFNTSRGYQTEQYFKVVTKYNETITDAKYKELLKGIDASQCLFGDDCKDSHLEMGLTTLGFDTVVDRYTDTIEVTFYKATGKGYEAQQSDKDLIKKMYTDEDFTCN